MFPHNRPPRRPPNYPASMHGNSLINSFKTAEGHWDIDKISKSIGQANKMYGQINPLLKQFTTMFKR